MQKALFPIAAASAFAVVAAVSLAGSATASSAGSAPGLVHGTSTHSTPTSAAQPAKGACYSENIDDSLTGIVSINTDDGSGWTSSGAVDFQVKKKCKITQVDATGVYAAGSGPADSFDVNFYKSKKGLPGKLVKTQNISGDFSSPVLSLTIKPVKLKKGDYFVSVVGNMNFSDVGGWFWELSTGQYGKYDSAFQNTGGAFGFCPTWEGVADCYGYSGDYMVALS